MVKYCRLILMTNFFFNNFVNQSNFKVFHFWPTHSAHMEINISTIGILKKICAIYIYNCNGLKSIVGLYLQNTHDQIFLQIFMSNYIYLFILLLLFCKLTSL